MKPSMYVLIALIPFVFLLDKLDDEELEAMIVPTLDEEDMITETPAEAIAQAREHLIPRRDELTALKVSELRKIVKDDFGISGHSKTKEKDLVILLITLELSEVQREMSLTEEMKARTAGARKIVEDASAEEKARAAAESATPEAAAPPAAPAPKPRKKKMDRPRARDIDEIEVLVQFHAPTTVVKGKTKTPSASPIARSIYRGEMARFVYGVALARDVKEPGFFKKHIKVRAHSS